MKLKIRIFTCIIVLFYVMLLPMTTKAASTIASGERGDQVKWQLTSDGTLKIYGKGSMKNYAYNVYSETVNTPWYNRRNFIKKVVVEKGIINIGECTFCLCDNIEIVSLPSSLTRIKNSAFMECDGLKSLTMYSSVEAIEDFAFYGVPDFNIYYYGTKAQWKNMYVERHNGAIRNAEIYEGRNPGLHYKSSSNTINITETYLSSQNSTSKFNSLIQKIKKMSKKKSSSYPNFYATGNSMTIGVRYNASWYKKQNYVYIKNTGNKKVTFLGVSIGDSKTTAKNKLANHGFFYSGGKYWWGDAGSLKITYDSKGKVKTYTYICAPTS